MRGKEKGYTQPAWKILKRACRNSNRKRSLALALTSGMLMLFGVLLVAFLQGKVRADQLRYQREHGSTAYVYVENGTSETAGILEQMPLVRQIGYEKLYGRLISNEIVYSNCSAMEEKEWKALKAAAYTDICGTYPKEANEIMMSVRILESLGIRNPQPGMKLSLEFYWMSVLISEETGPQEFVLSGYFTDYTGDSGTGSVSYISKKKMEQAGIPDFPCRILLDVDSGLRSGEQTEQVFLDAVSLAGDEYFVSEDSAFYRSLRGIAGSFAAGIFLLLLILLSAVLLIYQMIRLSFLRDSQMFETMRSLGVTAGQIRNVVCRQFSEDLLAGAVVGELLACLIVWSVFPRLVTHLYMGQAGTIVMASFLSVPFCVGAAAVVWLTGLLTVAVSVRTLSRKRAAGDRRMGKPAFRRLRRRRQERLWRQGKHFLPEAAWKSVTDSGGDFLFSILLVSMGGIAALCAVSLTSGTDLLRRLENQPDFQVGITYNSYEFLERQRVYASVDGQTPDVSETDFFPQELQNRLTETANRLSGTVEIRKGYLPAFDTAFAFDGAHIGMISELYRYAPDIPKAMICILSEEEEHRLLEQISPGRQRLKTGESILLHRGIPFPDPPGGSGQEVSFFAYDTGGSDSGEPAELRVVESVDLLKTDLADLNLLWAEENVCWPMVSEETFREFSETLQEYVLEVNLYVPEESQSEAEDEIRRYVAETNETFRKTYGTEADQVFLTCKSEVVAREMQYLKNSRFCMAAVCALLFLLGILTYISTWYLDLAMREKEQKTLYILGMTQRQQRAALRLEGIFHCMVLALFLAVVGNTVIFALDGMVKEQSQYFGAEYPWAAFLFLMLMFSAAAWLLPGKRKIHENGRR